MDSWIRSQMLKVALKHPLSSEKQIEYHDKADMHQKTQIETNPNASKEFIDHMIKYHPGLAIDRAASPGREYQNFSPEHFHKLMTSERTRDQDKAFLAHCALNNKTWPLIDKSELSKYVDHKHHEVSRIAKKALDDSNSKSR